MGRVGNTVKATAIACLYVALVLASIMFYITTPPAHVRKLPGFNVFSLSYLLISYSVKLVSDLVDSLGARGVGIRVEPLQL